MPKALHFGFNPDRNISIASNLSTKSWIKYGIESSICYCGPDRVFIPVYKLLQEYLPEAKWRKWIKYNPPDYFQPPINATYNEQSVAQNHQILQHNTNKTQNQQIVFPDDLTYEGKIFRKERSYKKNCKYRCRGTKGNCILKCRAILHMDYNNSTRELITRCEPRHII